MPCASSKHLKISGSKQIAPLTWWALGQKLAQACGEIKEVEQWLYVMYLTMATGFLLRKSSSTCPKNYNHPEVDRIWGIYKEYSRVLSIINFLLVQGA